MALNIKDPETDRLARQLAKKTGESITEAVKKAISLRLARESAKKPDLFERVRRIQEEVAKLPRLTDKSADEIIGYNDYGVPE